eukprot:jgi/Bigna1/83706/fgenesh1_pg.113_\
MSYKKAKAILIREFGQWGGLPIGNIDCSISGEDVDGTTTGDSRTTILSQLSNSEFRALFYPVIMEVAEECMFLLKTCHSATVPSDTSSTELPAVAPPLNRCDGSTCPFEGCKKKITRKRFIERHIIFICPKASDNIKAVRQCLKQKRCHDASDIGNPLSSSLSSSSSFCEHSSQWKTSMSLLRHNLGDQILLNKQVRNGVVELERLLPLPNDTPCIFQCGEYFEKIGQQMKVHVIWFCPKAPREVQLMREYLLWKKKTGLIPPQEWSCTFKSLRSYLHVGKGDHGAATICSREDYEEGLNVFIQLFSKDTLNRNKHAQRLPLEQRLMKGFMKDHHEHCAVEGKKRYNAAVEWRKLGGEYFLSRSSSRVAVTSDQRFSTASIRLGQQESRETISCSRIMCLTEKIKGISAYEDPHLIPMTVIEEDILSP